MIDDGDENIKAKNTENSVIKKLINKLKSEANELENELNFLEKIVLK